MSGSQIHVVRFDLGASIEAYLKVAALAKEAADQEHLFDRLHGLGYDELATTLVRLEGLAAEAQSAIAVVRAALRLMGFDVRGELVRTEDPVGAARAMLEDQP